MEIVKLLIDGWQMISLSRESPIPTRRKYKETFWNVVRDGIPEHSCEAEASRKATAPCGLSKRQLARSCPYSARRNCDARHSQRKQVRSGEPKEWTYFVTADFLFLVDGRERDAHADVRERPCESVLSFHHVVSGDPTRVVGLDTKHR